MGESTRFQEDAAVSGEEGQRGAVMHICSFELTSTLLQSWSVRSMLYAAPIRDLVKLCDVSDQPVMSSVHYHHTIPYSMLDSLQHPGLPVSWHLDILSCYSGLLELPRHAVCSSKTPSSSSRPIPHTGACRPWLFAGHAGNCFGARLPLHPPPPAVHSDTYMHAVLVGNCRKLLRSSSCL